MSTLLYSHCALLFLVKALDAASLDKSSGQKQRWEFIFSSELFETDNSIECDSVHKANDGWQHLNLKLSHKERTFFRINAHEPGLGVLLRNNREMVIHYLASFEVLVEEVHDYKIGLSDTR